VDGHIETTYLLELRQQCLWAVECLEAMNESLGRSAGYERVISFFGHAGHFLHHVGAASRILWPPVPREKEKAARARARGLHLRTVLGIPDDHALKKRTLRDHIEHLDERIDDWAHGSKNHNIVDFTFGPPGVVGGGGVGTGDVFRQYDPATTVFIFRGESFHVQTLAGGVGDVLERVTAKLGPPWGTATRR
jgi:hypothetical protein